ncbi:ATP-binding protein [Streptomyces sp. NPDC048290]|uniref:ATP-binding protein n=1 Tax=Streptomyces sp. NPDC048290 TaxID=3155811 RepID=UPI003419F6B8
MNPEISTPQLSRHFSSTPLGASIARDITERQVAAWGHPRGSRGNQNARQIVAELAANAVTHGHVRGRGCHLRLLLPTEDILRIEVSDARGERKLRYVLDPDAENGRGLIIVTVLSLAWGVMDRQVGKTVWAEVSLKEPGAR